MFDTRLGTDGNTAYDVENPAVWKWANGTWNRGALRLYYCSNYADYNDYTATGPMLTNNNGNVWRGEHLVPNALDGSGNITSWVMGTDTYSYDELNRLTQVTESATGDNGQGFTQKFIYDRWGNRTIDVAATTNLTGITRDNFTKDIATNQLTTKNGVALTYDFAGNQTYDATGSRFFDAENKIGKAVQGVTSYYYYDGSAKRARTVINGLEVWQVFGFEGELLAEYHLGGLFQGSNNPAAGSPTKEYGYRSGQMLVIFDNTEPATDDKLKWVVTDHLGSTRMLVNRSGSASGIKRRDYLPFGEELPATLGHRTASGSGYPAASSPKQKFGTYERDNETGLDFAQARYYANVQGRFTSVDPFDPILGKQGAGNSEAAERELRSYLRQPQHWNRYTYALNNPLKYVDPDGMDPITVNLNIIYDQNSNYTDEEKNRIRASYIAQAKKDFGKIDVNFNVTETTGTAGHLGTTKAQIESGANGGAINAFFTKDNVGPSSEATNFKSGSIFISTGGGANPRDLTHGIIHAAGIAGGENGYRGPTQSLNRYIQILAGALDYRPGSAEYHTEAIQQYLEGRREPSYTYGYNSAKTGAPPTVTINTTHTTKDMQVLKSGLQRYMSK